MCKKEFFIYLKGLKIYVLANVDLSDRYKKKKYFIICFPHNFY